MLSFKEFASWLQIRPIEVLFVLLGWFTFSLLIVLRYDFNLTLIDTKHIFMPLFITNGVHLYFILIVLLRLWFESKQRVSFNSAEKLRFIIQNLFLHLPFVSCLIMFNYNLYMTWIVDRTKSNMSTVFINCLSPLYIFTGWMFLKIFICKKQNNLTVVVQ